jgi:hypothetical protein
VAYRLHSGGAEGGRGADGGAVSRRNPPDGAILGYYLQSAPTTPVTLTILDSAGRAVRTFQSADAGLQGSAAGSGVRRNSSLLPAAHGMNRFVWDLRLDPPTGVPGAIYQEGSSLQGVLVMPGTYTLKLDVEGKSLTAPLELKLDPDVTTGPEDLQKQFDLAKKISDAISETHQAVNYLRAIDAQIGTLEHRMLTGSMKDQVLSTAKATDRDALAIEDALYQINKSAEKDSFNYGGRLNDMLIGLEAAVERADTAPTRQMYEVFDYLDSELQTQLQRRDNLNRTEIPALNKILRESGVLYVGALEVSSR